MNEILSALIETSGKQSVALQAVADTVSALKTVVSRLDQTVAADLQREIEIENQKSRVYVQQLLTQIAGLQAALSRMRN